MVKAIDRSNIPVKRDTAYHKLRQCTGKLQFPCESVAMEAISRLRDKSMMPYLCKYCRLWHMGH